MAKRDLILNNLPWKPISLLLAITVWFTFHTGGKVHLQMPDDLTIVSGTRTLSNISVSILRSSDDHREYRLTPGQVDIELGGEASELRRLMLADIHVFVDLRDGEAGPTLVTVNAPSGVRVERIIPLHVNVQLEKP